MSRIRIRHIHSALLFSVPRALKKALALALKMFGRKERLVGAELRHAQDLLSRRMFDKYGKLKAAFMARDYNGDGTIGYNDFRQLLRDLGITLPPREFRELVQAYDSDGDKEVSYPEILQRLSTLLSPEGDISSTARTDDRSGTRVLAAEKLLADKMFSKLTPCSTRSATSTATGMAS